MSWTCCTVTGQFGKDWLMSATHLSLWILAQTEQKRLLQVRGIVRISQG